MEKPLEQIWYLIFTVCSHKDRNIYRGRKKYLLGNSLYGGALFVLSCAEICYALPDLMDCEGFFPFWALYLLSLFATSQEWGIKTSNSDLVFFSKRKYHPPKKSNYKILSEKSENIKISLWIVLVNLICAPTNNNLSAI